MKYNKIEANTYNAFCENLYRLFIWQDVDRVENKRCRYRFYDVDGNVIATYDETKGHGLVHI